MASCKMKVAQKLLDKSDGRDKCMKFFQYFAKILLWKFVDSKQHAGKHDRLNNLAKTFSTTRKLLRLAHCVYPFNELREFVETGGFSLEAQNKNLKALCSSAPCVSPFALLPFIQPINMSLSILNDISDDIICLAKIGVLDKALTKRFEPLSEKLWFTCICFDLLDAFHGLRGTTEKIAAIERTIKKAREADSVIPLEDKKKLGDLQQKQFIQFISIIKLFCDLIFCGYDVFKSKRSEGIQHISGFVSGVIALYKLWVKCQ